MSTPNRELSQFASFVSIDNTTREISLGTTITQVNANELNVSGISTLGVTSATDLTSQTLVVSGISTLGNVSIYSGIVSATTGIVTYYGDGANLSNVIVGLGTQTFGDYVKNITGTSGEIEVSLASGEGVSPQIGLPNDVVISNDLTVNNNVQIFNNLNVEGNITVGGTSAYLIVNELQIKDKDIILGITTDIYGNDVSTDTTANHGGLAIASTEGTSLVSLAKIGINSLPDTYKQIMWVSKNTMGGGTTDAWLFNYGVGIGSTQVPLGVVLSAGNVQISNEDIVQIRNINASGIITSSQFIGPLTGNVQGNAATATTAFNVSGGIATVSQLYVSGISTLGVVTSDNIFSTGIITAAQFVGPLTGNIQGNAATATTANNLTGGVQGSIPFQSSGGITTFLPAGPYKYVLVSNGPTQDPYWDQVSAASGSFGGITIQDESNIVGTASSITTINFVGPRISASPVGSPSGIATITLLDYVSIAGYSTVSGIATNVIGGIASVTNLNVTGPSTIGTVQFSGGIVTATTFSGNLTGTANISNLNVSGVSTLGNLRVSSGIVTAVTGIVTYYGDGSNLLGVSAFSVVNQVLSSTPTYLTFATNVGVSSIGISTVASNSFVFIPATGFVGIGSTNPVAKLDVNGDVRVTGNVISLDANVGEIVRTTAGIVSTNSLNTIVLDTYNTGLYRSAKYVVQVTSLGSLIPGTTSISSITGGTNYFPGTYNAQDIIAGGAGVGSYGRADLTVVPEFSLVVNSCIDGVYTAAANLPAGITTNKTVYWTQNQNLSQRQQSQISSFLLTASGVGYTGVPTLTASAPIIASNPVPEVGIGSTARLEVVSMRVSNAVQTSAGFVTTVVPTITFSGPSIGVTALGLVSFGISTINVTNPGSGYTSPPSFTITNPSYNPTGFAATVGLGISSLNWVVSGGSGYTNGDLVTVSFNPIGGIGSGASITGVGVGGTIQFSITSPGTGYTTPPLVSVDSTGTTGTGATVSITRMIVSNINVTNPGSGVTVGLARTNDITFTGGGAFVTVSAGATAATLVSTGVTITNAGFGYTATTIPTITYTPPGAATAQVGLGISAIRQLSTGVGYTVVPSVTISPGPSVGTTNNAVINATLGYAGFAGTTIIAGPGYGATTVYYINVLSNRTFSITNDKGTALTPGVSTVGYGFSVGLSTARNGAVGINTTIITGVTTTGITVGTPVQNNTVISPGTTVQSIGSNSVTIQNATLNTISIASTSFNFGSTLIVGGRVNSVNITEIGSGYVAFQTNTARVKDFDRTSPAVLYDANVGTGFTFTVASVVNNFQLSDILTLHSVGSGSSTAYVIEQAGIADVAELGEFSASLGTGSTIYNLNFTPTFAYNTVKFNKTLFTV